jgi:glycosyltransferase involved in cell wall biosynthesis
LKILYVNKFFYLNGGSERVFFQERDYFLEKGYAVVDFSMQDYRNFESPFSDFFVNNIDYSNTKGIFNKLKNGLSFIHSSEAVKKLEKLILKEKPDIAHLHNIYHQLTPSIIPLLKRHNVKVVLTLHDYKLVCPTYSMLTSTNQICEKCVNGNFSNVFFNNCTGSKFYGLLMAAEAYWHKWKKSYELVDKFIAPSKFIAEMLRKRVPIEKIKVIPNGIDFSKINPSAADNEYAFFFGRISKEKGVETLLKAHELIKDRIGLKIAGTGPLLEELSCNYKHADFLGYKTGFELNRLIAESSFVVVPSEWYENCSMAVLESMAFGKAIIASKIGGIPEQVEDSKNGFLFERGNVEELAFKMAQLISDKKLREIFGEKSREKLEKDYSLTSHFEAFSLLYKDLISEETV